MSILSKNVKLIRRELRCTQSAMAEILRIGFRTYVRYEAGERDAPVSVLIKLAHLGNISLEQLLTQVIRITIFLRLQKFLRSRIFRKPNWLIFVTGR